MLETIKEMIKESNQNSNVLIKSIHDKYAKLNKNELLEVIADLEIKNALLARTLSAAKTQEALNEMYNENTWLGRLKLSISDFIAEHFSSEYSSYVRMAKIWNDPLREETWFTRVKIRISEFFAKKTGDYTREGMVK